MEIIGECSTGSAAVQHGDENTGYHRPGGFFSMLTICPEYSNMLFIQMGQNGNCVFLTKSDGIPMCQATSRSFFVHQLV